MHRQTPLLTPAHRPTERVDANSFVT